jgi:hypothetical protein
MFFFHGKNLLNLILANQLIKQGLHCFFIDQDHFYSPPPLYVALNHHSLNFLRLPNDFGTHFSSMHVQASSLIKEHFFTLQSEHINLRYLGQIVFLPKLYDHFKSMCPQFHGQQSRQDLCFASSSFYKPTLLNLKHLGSARQLIVNTEGADQQALQVFSWPHILGFLPIAENKHALIFSSTQSTSIPWNCTISLLNFINKILSKSLLRCHTIEDCSESFLLKSYHARSYFNEGKILFGDAAHSLHPLAGQGLNLGLADAQTLLTLLLENQAQEAFFLTKIFERKRYAPNHFMVHFCHQLSLSTSRWWSPWSFDLFQRSHFLKKILFPFYQQTSWTACHEHARL